MPTSGRVRGLQQTARAQVGLASAPSAITAASQRDSTNPTRPWGWRMAVEQCCGRGKKSSQDFAVTHHPHSQLVSIRGLMYLWRSATPRFCSHSLFLPVSSRLFCSLAGSQKAGRGRKQEDNSEISVSLGLCSKSASLGREGDPELGEPFLCWGFPR